MRLEKKKHTEICLRPVTISVLSADLLDFEPFCIGSIELVARGRSTGSHVGQHGSGVMRPLKIIPTIIRIDLKKKKSNSSCTYLAKISSSPIECDSVARIGVCHEGTRRRIWSASEGGVLCTLVGVLRADLSDDTGSFIATRGVTAECFSVDSYCAQKPMSRDIGCREEGKEE